jgi:hypothetical protein
VIADYRLVRARINAAKKQLITNRLLDVALGQKAKGSYRSLPLSPHSQTTALLPTLPLAKTRELFYNR